MSATAQENSLFEIDAELDTLLDEIQEEIENRGEAGAYLMDRFQKFCEAHSEKVDRIGRFLRMMEARMLYCKSEAARLQERSRLADNKIARTKCMVLYYLKSRDLRKIEGREFTLRLQKNSQDSVRIIDETQVPLAFREVDVRVQGSLWESVLECLPLDVKVALLACIQQKMPNNEAIRQAIGHGEIVPGAEVHRGSHVRVA
jgi:hypothetical protein